MNSTLQTIARDYLGIETLQGGDDAGQTNSSNGVNVGNTERLVSIGVGALLVAHGLSRRGISGLVTAGAGAALLYRSYSGHCSLYEKLGITSATAAPPEKYFDEGIHVEVSTTINRSPAELYTFWRQLDNLPKFMNHLESVTVIDDTRSHWVAKAPAGLTVQWDAEIINDVPEQTIAWRSLAGASVDNAGSVRFVDAGNGATEVRVVLDYIPPAGTVGKYVARLFGEEPQQQITDDLGRLKQLMESGEAPVGGGESSSQGTVSNVM